MNTILVWYLVAVGNNRSVTYSPPLPTVEECLRLQQIKPMAWVQDTQCVQLKVVVLK